jgi:lysophospholipase L1-like esterase
MRTFPRASILTALAGLLVASSLAGCGEDPKPVDYLALGDSAAFGYRPNAPGGYDDAGDFVGYPTLLAEDRGLRVRDLSCPGETTASFLDVDAPNLCTNYVGAGREGRGYRERAPLHSDYDGAQLDAALETLEDEPGIELVTLQLGANDLVVCAALRECATPEGVTRAADRTRENIETVLDALRDEGGYDGTIVVVNYGAYQYERDDRQLTGTEELELAAIEEFNAAIAEAAAAHDALLADTFEAFRVASQAEGHRGNVRSAGLVYPDDTHPTAAGQRLIARTVQQLL